jgi:hypothetical protein
VRVIHVSLRLWLIVPWPVTPTVVETRLAICLANQSSLLTPATILVSMSRETAKITKKGRSLIITELMTRWSREVLLVTRGLAIVNVGDVHFIKQLR